MALTAERPSQQLIDLVGALGGTWQALGQARKSPDIPPGLNLIGLVGVGKINARGNLPSTLAKTACIRHNHAANFGATAVSIVS